MSFKQSVEKDLMSIVNTILELDNAYLTLMATIDGEIAKSTILLKEAATNEVDKQALLNYIEFLECFKNSISEVNFNKTLTKALNSTILK